MAKHKTAKRKATKRKTSAREAENDNMPPGYAAIRFTGTAGEYFGIWIMTLLLTIITLGFYWPWAKVRRRRYITGHTEIDGHGMAYHATGKQLFIGFVLALIAVAAIAFISQVSTIGAFLIGGVGLFFVRPWAINRSLAFHARYTSWRNIHLRWEQKYWWMVLISGVFPIINLVSLGLLVPVTTRIAYNHYAKKHGFGTKKFNSSLRFGQVYRAFFLAILASLAVMILPVAVVTALVLALLPGAEDVGFALVPYMFVLGAYVFFGIFLTLARNRLVQSMRLGNVARFTSVMHPGRYIWIELTNTIVIILSLGLMVPWAVIRKYRYLCTCTGYKISGSVDKLVEGEIKKQSAFGEEFAAAEGIGFDLGL